MFWFAVVSRERLVSQWH